VGGGIDTDGEALRTLPAVHELAAALDAPHALAVIAARRAVDEERARLLAGQPARGETVVARAAEIVDALQRTSLRRVINASGVIVHTNLGRAPLPAAARAAIADTADGYSNLELSLESGRRDSRHVHVAELLCELTGAEDAIAVNNGAAAVLLATAALAGPGRAVVVSRAQLVEIGGGFRIPEVIAQSCSELVEVGTTNRTTLGDYERAVASAGERLGAVLRVHQSNFRTIGFVAEVAVEELCRLGVPVIDDIGSGALADPAMVPAIDDEPSLRESIAAGAALVCCSGDKLLGGPQAGLLLGRREAIRRARAHPLARAVRIDKLSLAALEATLALYRDPARASREIPVLAMLRAEETELERRAELIRAEIGVSARLVRASARVGGGALPLLELEGPAVAVEAPDGADALASALRASEPPVIGRIHEGRLLLDPRTLTDAEAAEAGRAVAAALR
jgi:L-seryl-tRNA(Ser) seleniumtransferase